MGSEGLIFDGGRGYRERQRHLQLKRQFDFVEGSAPIDMMKTRDNVLEHNLKKRRCLRLCWPEAANLELTFEMAWHSVRHLVSIRLILPFREPHIKLCPDDPPRHRVDAAFMGCESRSPNQHVC
jgi:hypothetical protein